MRKLLGAVGRALVCLGVLLVLLACNTSWASEPEPTSADRVVYKKKTVIDLTGVLIEGELTKPEGMTIISRKVSRFSDLIRLRENFVPELLASPDQF